MDGSTVSDGICDGRRGDIIDVYLISDHNKVDGTIWTPQNLICH